MSLDTYTNLKTAIADYLNRDDLTSYIPDFITLAEQMIYFGGMVSGQEIEAVRVKEMETRLTASLSTSSRYLALPDGTLSAKRLYITSTTPIHLINYVPEEQINDFYSSTAGAPNYFTMIGSELMFEKQPDSAYTVEISIYKKVTALSGSNASNDILTYYPALYLYGSLLAAEPFLMNDARMAFWLTCYQSAAFGANKTTKRGKVSLGSLAARGNAYPA